MKIWIVSVKSVVNKLEYHTRFYNPDLPTLFFTVPDLVGLIMNGMVIIGVNQEHYLNLSLENAISLSLIYYF